MTNRNLILVCFALSALFIAASAKYVQVWADEFNGDSLDMKVWGYQVDCIGGGNDELQCYTNRPENVKVADGYLTLTARREDYGNKKFTSGRIDTKHRLSFTYGRIDIRAQLPGGPFFWPALWMLPEDEKFGVWSASGEIDIMEARGQNPNNIESTLHYGAPHGMTGSGPRDVGAGDLTRSFHVYTLIWTPDQMQFAVDDKVYYTVNLNRDFSTNNNHFYKNAREPFNQRFFFVFNVALGGNFFGGDKNKLWDQQLWTQWYNPTMKVDYIRVYQDDGKGDGGVVPVPTTPKPATQAPATQAPTPSTTQGTYGPIDSNTDRYGGDLGNPVNAASAQACQELCWKNDKCQSFSFGACGGLSGQCWLKSGTPTQKPTQCVSSGTITAPRGDKFLGPIEVNTDRFGGDLVSGVSVFANSSESCQQQCFKNEKCQSWAYGTCGDVNNKCYLKGTQPSTKAAQCVNSGIITATRTPALQTCGSTQFDPNQYQCVKDETIQGKVRLCPPGPFSSCNGCYDNTIYRCKNGALQSV